MKLQESLEESLANDVILYQDTEIKVANYEEVAMVYSDNFVYPDSWFDVASNETVGYSRMTENELMIARMYDCWFKEPHEEEGNDFLGNNEAEEVEMEVNDDEDEEEDDEEYFGDESEDDEDEEVDLIN